MTLTATVIKGLGAATANLKKQLPPIAEEFPEVRDCFHGTLNVELERGLLVLSADHRTKPVNWDPAHAPGECLTFCGFALRRRKAVKRFRLGCTFPIIRTIAWT